MIRALVTITYVAFALLAALSLLCAQAAIAIYHYCKDAR